MANYKALALAGIAAVALSGCSWIGGTSKHGAQGHYGEHGGQFGYAPGQAYAGAPAHGPGPCQVASLDLPIPAGCAPEAVTLGLPGGTFAQQPDFAAAAAPTYASAGFGTATRQLLNTPITARETTLRKPKLRGFLQTGIEKSIAGSYLDYDEFPGVDPAITYNPDDFAEGSVEAVANGTNTTTYSAIVEGVNQPTLSNDDIHSTPANVTGGLEYILTPSTTVFGSAGYAFAEGNSGDIVTVDGELRRTVTQSRVDAAGNPLPDVVNTRFIPNVEGIASYAVDTSDMRRIDLELGARHYLSSLESMPKVTPFVAASAGASHYNRQTLDFTQRQAFFQRAFEAGEVDATYEANRNPAALGRVDVFDSQWVASGQLNAGVEWQATPKTAIAFETGVRVKGGRRHSDRINPAGVTVEGGRENADISIPLTIRGSYNF